MFSARNIILGVLITILSISCSNSVGNNNSKESIEYDTAAIINNSEQDSLKSDINKTENILEGIWYANYPEDTLWTRYGTLEFDFNEHTYHAYNGCNHLSSEFSYRRNKIIFEDGTSTMMGCDNEGIFGIPDFNVALDIRKVRKWNSEGFEIGNSKDLSIVLLKEGKWMLKGKWLISSINNHNIEDKDVTVTFDIEKNMMKILNSNSQTEIPFKSAKGSNLSFSPVLDNGNYSINKKDLLTALKSIVKFTPQAGNTGTSVIIRLQNEKNDTLIELTRSTVSSQ